MRYLDMIQRYLSREDVLKYSEVGIREIIVLHRVEKYQGARAVMNRVLLGEKFIYNGIRYIKVGVKDIIEFLGEEFYECGGLDFVRV